MPRFHQDTVGKIDMKNCIKESLEVICPSHKNCKICDGGICKLCEKGYTYDGIDCIECAHPKIVFKNQCEDNDGMILFTLISNVLTLDPTQITSLETDILVNNKIVAISMIYEIDFSSDPVDTNR